MGEIKYDSRTDELRILLEPEIDHHATESIRDEIDSAISRYGAHRVIFDFAEVAFMDSSAVGLLMGRYRLMQDMGGTVGAINLSSHCRKLLEISGVAEIIDF